jgi:hypothetical protein
MALYTEKLSTFPYRDTARQKKEILPGFIKDQIDGF